MYSYTTLELALAKHGTIAPREVVRRLRSEGWIVRRKGRYGIYFPDFPGCVSGGRSLDEAVSRGQEALSFHIAGMIEDGDPLPLPRTLQELKADPVFIEDAEGATVVAVPVELPRRAVRVNVSLEESLLESIDRAARASGKSRSAFLADAARALIKGAA